MNIQLTDGYTLFLTHNEIVALCRAMREYIQLHNVQDRESMTLDEAQTVLFLASVASKLPDEE